MTQVKTETKARISMIDLLAPYLIRVPYVTLTVPPTPPWWEHPDCQAICEDIAACLLHPTSPSQPAQ